MVATSLSDTYKIEDIPDQNILYDITNTSYYMYITKLLILSAGSYVIIITNWLLTMKTSDYCSDTF